MRWEEHITTHIQGNTEWEGNLHTLSVGKYQILGKEVVRKRSLNKFCRRKKRERHPKNSEEEHIFESDCQWKPGEHFRKSSLGFKEVNHLGTGAVSHKDRKVAIWKPSAMGGKIVGKFEMLKDSLSCWTLSWWCGELQKPSQNAERS